MSLSGHCQLSLGVIHGRQSERMTACTVCAVVDVVQEALTGRLAAHITRFV